MSITFRTILSYCELHWRIGVHTVSCTPYTTTTLRPSQIDLFPCLMCCMRIRYVLWSDFSLAIFKKKKTTFNDNHAYTPAYSNGFPTIPTITCVDTDVPWPGGYRRPRAHFFFFGHLGYFDVCYHFQKILGKLLVFPSCRNLSWLRSHTVMYYKRFNFLL